MVLNYIWVAFFVIAFIVALCKLIFMGDVEIFTELVNSTFSSSKTAFEISLGLTGILALWLGVMKIGENSGMINALSRWLSPVFCRLFPEIPKGHPAMGSIFMNLSANMLGLDNAATPMGLKAMKDKYGLVQQVDALCNADGNDTDNGRDGGRYQCGDKDVRGLGGTHLRAIHHDADGDKYQSRSVEYKEHYHTYPDWLHQSFLCRTHLSVHTD